VHGSLGYRAIIVQVGDGVGENIHPPVRGGGERLRLVGGLTGSDRLLIHLSGLGLHGLDTGLCTGIDVLDVLGVLGRQVVELVGFVDEWRRLLPHVILAGASHSSGHAGRQENRQ